MSRKTVVYFVGCGDFIKIGVTTNLLNRLDSLQSLNPHPISLLGCVAGNRGCESVLHHALRDSNHFSEWFRRTDQVELVLSKLPPVSSELADAATKALNKARTRSPRKIGFGWPLTPDVKKLLKGWFSNSPDSFR